MVLIHKPQAPLLPPSSSSDSSDSEDGGVKGSALRFSDLTYGDIGLYAFGSPGKRLVDVAIVFSQVGKLEALRSHRLGFRLG